MVTRRCCPFISILLSMPAYSPGSQERATKATLFRSLKVLKGKIVPQNC